MQNTELIIHTDGGSRGNPGPAAAAFVVDQNGTEIFKASKYLGKQTNNYAEYSAVLLALEWLSALKETADNGYTIIFFLDSELVVKQINGLYKVKDENLKIIFNKIMSQIKQLSGEIVFKHIPREQNKIADFLVNQELDAVKVSRL